MPQLTDMKRPDPRKRGTALTAALVVVVTVASLGAYLIQMQAAMARRQAMSIDTRTALYTAEAGLAEAAYQVSQGRSGTIGSKESPAEFNGNKYWVESEGFGGNEISLTATALAGKSRFSVNLAMLPNQNPVAVLGVFGDEGVHIGDRVLVDGYDARDGDYASACASGLGFTTTGSGAVVGSNGDVVIDDGLGGADQLVARVAATLRGPFAGRSLPWLFESTDPILEKRHDHGREGVFPGSTMILGTVSAGPGGVVLPGAGTRIDAIDERENEAVLPEVVLPGDLAFEGAGVHEIVKREEWGDAAQRVDGFVVRPGGSLHLVGPLVLEAESFAVEPGARLVIDDSGGPVTLYCTGSFDAQEGSLVSMARGSEQQHGFTLLVPRPLDVEDDERVTLDALGDLRGVIYAPGDRLTIRAGMKIYGSVVAKHVTLDDDAWVSVDAALEIGGTGLPSLSKSRRWQIVTPSDEDVAVAARSEAKPPAEIAAEKFLEVIYMDANDARASYSGHVNRFDATLAERIIAVRWQDPATREFSDWIKPAGASPEKVITRWRKKLREKVAAAEKKAKRKERGERESRKNGRKRGKRKRRASAKSNAGGSSARR